MLHDRGSTSDFGKLYEGKETRISWEIILHFQKSLGALDLNFVSSPIRAKFKFCILSY